MKKGERARSARQAGEAADAKNGSGEREPFLRYSFGALYVPNSGSYLSSYTRYYINGDENIVFNQAEYSETRMEARFTYLFTRRLGLTAEIGYKANYYRIRSEDHITSNSGSNDDGGKALEDTKIFSALLSVKYYLFSSRSHKVQPYVFIGAGKEFADYVSEYERLFVDNPPADVIVENYEKYKSDINSPFVAGAGFGVEYFFDDTHSVKTVMRFGLQRMQG